MKRCSLCNRKISNEEYNFGLGCLKKACNYVGITGVKNLAWENKLNNKIAKLNGKVLLNKTQKQLLTNRYLTFQLLNQIEIPYYKKLATNVGEDVSKINNTAKKKTIKTNSMITLQQALKLLELYERYKNFFNKAGQYTSEELKNEIQNLPWDTIMFAFSSYYERKPYLSELIQVVQFFVWKIGAKIFSTIFECGSEFLDYSLQEKPEDMYITEGKIVDEIINDENFNNKIDEILEKYGNKDEFDTEQTEYLNYKNPDLILALNNTGINVKGNKVDGKWNLNVKITDIYDFTDLKEFSEYVQDNKVKNFILSILNNSAMLSSAYNVINTYNITIEFNIER